MDIALGFLLLPVAGIVVFAAVSAVIGHYRAGYGAAERSASVAAAIGTMAIFSLGPVGELVLVSGRTRENITGILIIVIVVLTVLAVFILLRRKFPPDN